MNDNTILRIKVPAHLYESVKEQLTLTEAQKSKHNLGAGMEIVKEKKMKTPKDGMKKIEEMNHDKKHRSLDELKKAKAALDKKIHEMESVDEVGAGVEYAWIPAAAAALGITASLVKSVVKYMKDNNLKGMKGFMQAYKEVGGDASSAIDKKMGGGLEEKKKEVNELFGLGAKIEVRDKADVKKMVKVGAGDLVAYKPEFDNSGYSNDNQGVYIIDKIKDGKAILLKKAERTYQTNQGNAARDVSGTIVDAGSLAYWGKK
jgi:hypothetical protein